MKLSWVNSPKYTGWTKWIGRTASTAKPKCFYLGKDKTEAELKAIRLTLAYKQLVARGGIHAFQSRWQDNPPPLRACNIIFGCVDGFAERRELETAARRYLVPLLDIGMDVQPPINGQPPRMAGQVILSMPGCPCLTCVGFLNEKTLAQEAALYGAAGSRPQVVWSNGVLASTAVGIAVDLLTDWTRSLRDVVYMSFDGNRGTLTPHARLPFAPTVCSHFEPVNVGDPVIRPA